MKLNRPFLRQLAGWSVLVLVPILLFAKPIFRGEVLIPTDILPVIDDIWAAKVTPNNPLLSDILLQFLPWQKFSAQTFSMGQLPLWNPYMMAGTPFLANDQSAIFDPLRFFTLITRFPVEHSFLFLAVGRLVLFGLFTAYWLRVRGFSQDIAILVGALASLSAPAVVWVSYPLFATFLWLPLLLSGLENIHRNRRRGWLIVAGAVTAQWFSGNIQISIFVLLFCAAYALLVLRPSWRSLMAMSIAVLLGTGIAAIQLLPTAEYVRQSPVFESGRGGYGNTNIFRAIQDGSWRGWNSFKETRESLERLLPILSPFVNGNPASGKYRFPNNDIYANMNELAGSVGGVGLLLAILGLMTSWRERLVKFSLGVTTVIVGVIAHVPIFELINTLPLLQQTQSDRLRFLLTFCLLIFAAFGLRALIDGRVSWKKFGWVAAILLFALTLIGWRIGVGSDWKLELVVIVFGVALLLVSRIRALKTQYRALVIGLALLVGPIVLWQNYNTSVNPKNEDLGSTIIDALNSRWSQDTRLVSFGTGRGRTPLEPNTAMIYDFLDVRGYDVVRIKRYDELVNGILTRSGSHLKGATKPSEILNALSVRYGLVAARDVPKLDTALQADGWRVVTEDDAVRLYENAKWQPRAWFTSTVEEVVDAQASLRAVRADTFSADVPVIETGKNIRAATDGVSAPVVINFSEPNTVSLTVDAPKNGYVILADAFMEGWKVSVNGKSTTIFPANHALRAVRVSPGAQTLIFQYQPKSFQIGLWVSIGSILVLVGVVVVWRRRV